MELDRSHIIDVRNIGGGNFEHIPFEEVNKRYIWRVSPYDVITDMDYFIKSFEQICCTRGILFSSHDNMIT